MTKDLERERRDFKGAHPLLYAYIAHIEAAKALDSAGDAASGATNAHGAANRAWARSAQHRADAAEVRAAYLGDHTQQEAR